jgi:RNA polymerase sigma-70 factor, ECF subfamily
VGEVTDVDAALLARIASGQQPALAMLYDRLSPLAYGLALRILRDPGVAEDAVQEAFLRIWQRAAHYEPARGAARPWLLRLVRNLAIDKLRTQTAHTRIDGAFTDVPTVLPPQPDDLVEFSERATRIRTELAALPAEQRRAIESAYFEGMSHGEIADRDGTPLGTVKSRIRDGVLRLRARFVGEAEHG